MNILAVSPISWDEYVGLSFQVPPAAAGPAAAGGDDEAPGQTAAQAAAEAATVLPPKRPAGVHAATTLVTSVKCAPSETFT